MEPNPHNNSVLGHRYDISVTDVVMKTEVIGHLSMKAIAMCHFHMEDEYKELFPVCEEEEEIMNPKYKKLIKATQEKCTCGFAKYKHGTWQYKVQIQGSIQDISAYLMYQ